MSEMLKPCPFCGSEDAYSVYLPDPYSRDQYAWVNCKTCNASGGQFVQRVYPDDKSFSRNEMELESTKLWNTRPIEDALQARAEKAEEMVEWLIELGDVINGDKDSVWTLRTVKERWTIEVAKWKEREE